jgi:hypothetical protein
MSSLPITRMTLYKHGVGFFERRGTLHGGAVELPFRIKEMKDILKSLTAIDLAGGQVLGIEYPTPQLIEERLAGCSIRLGNDRSLRDLLIGLRGASLRLLLDQGEEVRGVMVGADEPPERHPLSSTLVSLLRSDSNRVDSFSLSRIQGVEIEAERSLKDLRFFLKTAALQEEDCLVKIHLSPGDHDLSVSYIAPAPTWRVSYRLVADSQTGTRAQETLLLGWGIFDNNLEEDLQEIALSLVAGMPISFVYDLFTPFTPERPVIEEESRVAPGPVEFEAPAALGAGFAAPAAPPMRAMAMMETAKAPAPISAEALRSSTTVMAAGKEMGELFQYRIGTPVSVGRGQSAMVPIVSASLSYRKDLIYNGAKLPEHPVATLRFENHTGLTLERGPVTVVENGEYVGEAILPFTAHTGEVTVPYAVELGVKIRQEHQRSLELRAIRISGALLLIEEWEIQARKYLLQNTTDKNLQVLIEHPRSASYSLFDTPEPRESTLDMRRFDVPAASHAETVFEVRERALRSRREELRKQSYAGLQQYLKQGLIDRLAHDRLRELLELWEKVTSLEVEMTGLDKERQKIYQAQEQIRGNMGALESTGKEGALRASYVDKLQAAEQQLEALAAREQALKASKEQTEREIETRLKALG